MRRIAGGAARAEIVIEADGVLATHPFLWRRTAFAFLQARPRRGNVVGDPMIGAGTTAAVGILHHDREALGARRRVRPRERRRYVFAAAGRLTVGMKAGIFL